MTAFRTSSSPAPPLLSVVFGDWGDMKLASGIDIEEAVVGAGVEASKGHFVSTNGPRDVESGR